LFVLEDFPFGQPTELFHELAYFLDKAIEHSLNDFQFFFFFFFLIYLLSAGRNVNFDALAKW